MGQALYRKYRPKKLDEIIGQEHITETLKNAIKHSKISHAYLLTGPRGVGKTSVARILAYEVNDIPYDEQQSHLDIIEIDAASNRRIDEIRDLRDKVHILPSMAKYKVYIIDEVHMLTREAFNALLKTLEEPPEHAIFILATTEAHKLPETIVSRTQHFTFKPIEIPTLVGQLQMITKSEKLKIDESALTLIAEHGDGSFRDSISLLDQARSISDHITELQVQQLLGITPAAALDSIVTIITVGTAKELFDSLAELRATGLQSANVAKQLGQKIRRLIHEDPAMQSAQTAQLLRSLLEVAGSPQPDRLLEIVLLEYIFAQNPIATSPHVAPLQATSVKTEATPEVKKTESKIETTPAQVKETPKPETEKSVPTPVEKTVKAQTEETPEEVKPKAKPSQSSGNDFTIEAWPLVVSEVKKGYNTLYGILRMAEAEFNGDTLTLYFKFPFHQKQINESKNRTIITDIIKAQTGSNITLVCKVNAAKKAAKQTTKPSADNLETVSNIFGSAEVLDS